MLSIGVLGFIVWSLLVASPWIKQWLNKLAICLDNLVLWNPFYRKNFYSYIKWAGNYTFYYKVDNSNIKNDLLKYLQRLYANNCYINYLNQFPLKIIKKHSFKKWKDVYDMIFNKKHVTFMDLSIIRSLRTNMNKYNIDNRSVGSSPFPSPAGTGWGPDLN
jgi:Fe-S cluster biosynthesis and repair protein YggX